MKTSKPFPIIHINGYPGAGKRTIARILVGLLDAFEARLVHNHLLIDPAGAVLPRTSSDYQALRRKIREAVFDTLVQSADTMRSMYVFTDYQSSDALGTSVVAEYESTALRRGCDFIPVIVQCSTPENLRRYVSEERTLLGKVTDVALLSHFRDNAEVHRFSNHPLQLELDVTNLEPAIAARLIYEHVLSVCQDLRSAVV
ncbi:MAG: hypothetical protein M1819_003563 [Sarea resinae]|nr:MAG: hypothetical protein M1819_003563 [Sarea resinae]